MAEVFADVFAAVVSVSAAGRAVAAVAVVVATGACIAVARTVAGSGEVADVKAAATVSCSPRTGREGFGSDPVRLAVVAEPSEAAVAPGAVVRTVGFAYFEGLGWNTSGWTASSGGLPVVLTVRQWKPGPEPDSGPDSEPVLPRSTLGKNLVALELAAAEMLRLS